MNLYPKCYLKNVTKIDKEFLVKNNIKGLILDVDNTLVDINKVLSDEIIEWHRNIVKLGIKTMILSNSIHKSKVEKIAQKLEIDYINFAKKPFKGGFIKARNKLELPFENIAMVGDQIFPDVVGANRVKMFSILVEPLSKTEPFRVKWKRALENIIIKRYLNRK